MRSSRGARQELRQEAEAGHARALAVSHLCACIGSPCLRQYVHGAPIGGGGRAR
eukprot:COSAG01_NODE_54542_length_331_cov_1.034483_1_plen_53_part_01